MRRAPIPHGSCGGAHTRGRRQHRWSWAALALFALTVALPVALPVPFGGGGARAQSSSFPQSVGDIFGPAPKIDQAQPLFLQADQLIYDTKNNRVVAQGNVEIYYNNYILTADQVIYDQNVNKLTALGNAQLKDPNGTITRADRFEALDDFRDAFVQSLSVVTKDDTRIAAERATRREGNVNEYERGKFTPCKSDPGMPPLWCISAARIIHDQRAATIAYQDAQFEIFGVPVLYTPYFEHPDPSVKRRSGFLTPEIGNSTLHGYFTEIPYYFALAPNYDFTFHPRYYTKEGVLWQGDWRHRLAEGEYSVKLAGIDQQSSPDNGWRGTVESKGQFSLSSWWRYGWDATYESDKSFRRFYSLDPIFQNDRINTAYLQGMSERNYFSARLYDLESLQADPSKLANSRVLPVIDYNYIVGQPVLGGELSFTGHARSLTRDDGTDSNHVVAEANWRRKTIDPLGQVWTPFTYLRGDLYNYSDATDPDTGLPIPDNTAWYGNAAVGVLYSYPFVAHTEIGSHVIEPMAQIIARPNNININQRKLPDEDARSLVVDDTLLFDIDKFSGYDRMETGTRGNVGLQYTFQGNNGFYARTVFGESYQLAGQNPFANPGLDSTGIPNFSPINGLQTTASDYIAGLYVSPFAGLSLISQARFDQHDWTLQREDSLLQGHYGPVFGSVGYVYTRWDPLFGVIDPQQEIQGNLGLKLTDRWSIGGMLRYDLEANKTIQDQYLVKYADECFVLTASYTQTFVTNEALNLRPDQTVMLRFELKYLGSYDYRTSVLDHSFGDTRGNVPN
jgi:LPS-assembly protein